MTGHVKLRQRIGPRPGVLYYCWVPDLEGVEAMAKKKAARKPEPQAAKVIVNATPSTPTYYANQAEVSHSMHEFVFAFNRVPTKLTEAMRSEVAKQGWLTIEPEAQVTIPPTLLRPLIKVLESQIQKYEASFGKILSKESKDGRK